MGMKFARIGATVALGSMVLSGCGGAGGDSSGTSGASGDSGNTVNLKMVESLTNPARTALIKELLADFEKENPNIKVELISPPTEQADQKIQQMLQAGTGVDVLEVRDLTVGPFSNNGWLLDMADHIKQWDGYEKLTEQAKKFTIDSEGHSYLVPYGFYGLSLFYRTDLVEEAGFDLSLIHISEPTRPY